MRYKIVIINHTSFNYNQTTTCIHNNNNNNNHDGGNSDKSEI